MYYKRMTSKLQNKAQKSKLQEVNSLAEDKLISLDHQISSSIRSFRLDNQSWQDLQEILSKLNNHSQRKKISASLLIKAFIYLGKVSSEDKLIKALREVAV